MQIRASPFKTSRCCAHKGAGGSGGEQPVREVAWGKTRWRGCAAGKPVFTTKRKRDLQASTCFCFIPRFLLNHSAASCTRLSNHIRATWLQTRKGSRNIGLMLWNIFLESFLFMDKQAVDVFISLTASNHGFNVPTCDRK